jgi:hypothetical protein
MTRLRSEAAQGESVADVLLVSACHITSNAESGKTSRVCCQVTGSPLTFCGILCFHPRVFHSEDAPQTLRASQRSLVSERVRAVNTSNSSSPSCLSRRSTASLESCSPSPLVPQLLTSSGHLNSLSTATSEALSPWSGKTRSSLVCVRFI